MAAKPPATSKSIDLSSFDSLLPGLKDEKKTLKQMSNPQTGMSQGFSPSQGQTSGGGAGVGIGGYMGQGMMGNVAPQGMLGNMGQQGMMGNVGMMGQQGMMVRSPMPGYQMNAGGFGQAGMFGSQGVPASMQTNMNSPFMAVPQTNTQTSSAQKSELDDLFG